MTTGMDNTERKFYRDTIANLLQYNGQLISAIVSRGGMPPIPTMPSFGIEVNLDDMKKMQSAWKDSPLNFGSITPEEMMRKLMGMPRKDTEEDPLK